MNHVYSSENTRERQRLQALIARLSDEELNCPLENGWTVATTLAHLAFWDHYRWVELKNWEQTGAPPSEIDEAINEAVHLLAAAIPQRSAAQLALAAAETIDQALEQTSSSLAQAIEASGHIRLLRRALHRREHLDQIEEALRAS